MKFSSQFLALAVTSTICCTSANGFVRETANRRPQLPFVSVDRRKEQSKGPPRPLESPLNVASHYIDLIPTAQPSRRRQQQQQQQSLQDQVKARYDAVKKLVVGEQDAIGKVAGLTNFFSSFALVATGLTTGFTKVPQALGPLNHLWVASTIVMSVVSLKSAVKTRAKQPAVRNWIMGFSFMAICLSAMAEWVSPFAPAIVRNPVVSRAAFARLSGIVSLFNLKNMHGGGTLMENRKDDACKVPRVIDYITYVAPNVIGLVWSGWVAWFIGLRHSKHSYLNFLAKTTAGAAATQALAYYTCIISTVCALYTPQIANLRDRKILSKKGEIAGNLALAAVAWAINGLAISQGVLPFPGLPKFLFRR